LKEKDLISIGKIVRHQGKYGEVRVKSFTDNLLKIKKDNVFLIKGGEIREVKIQKKRLYKDYIIVKFEGIDNLTEVEKIRGSLIAIKREDLPSLEDKYEFYLCDIEDAIIKNKKGDIIGRVDYIFQTGEIFILVVKGEKEFMIPFVEDYILSVDIKKKEIVLQNEEELLSL